MENPFEVIALELKEIRQAQAELSRKLDELAKAGSDPNELIPRMEKAKQLKVSLPTLKNWEDQGLIFPVRIGRKVYFNKNDNPKSKYSTN